MKHIWYSWGLEIKKQLLATRLEQWEKNIRARPCQLKHPWFYENKPPAPKRSEKMTAEIFFSFGVVVHQPIFVSQKPHVSTWSVLTNQISSLIRSNYKFSLKLRAKARNKLTWIHKKVIVRSLGCAVKLNLWANEGSIESQKSVSFHSGVIW